MGKQLMKKVPERFKTEYTYKWDFSNQPWYWCFTPDSSKWTKEQTFDTGILADTPHSFIFCIEIRKPNVQSRNYKPYVKTFIGKSSGLKAKFRSNPKIENITASVGSATVSLNRGHSMPESFSKCSGNLFRNLWTSRPKLFCCCLFSCVMLPSYPIVKVAYLIARTYNYRNFSTGHNEYLELGPQEESVTFKITTSHSYVPPNLKETCPLDMEQLFTSPKYSDVSIQCGDVVFPAHKLILCQRSPVLDRAFSTDMKEAGDGKLEIPNAKPETVKNLLYFMYTGTLPTTLVHTKDLVQLLTLSHQYLVDSILEVCEGRLLKKIKVKNVLELYELSELVGANVLQTSCFEFFKKTQSKLIKNQKDLLDFMKEHPKLMSSFMQEILFD